MPLPDGPLALKREVMQRRNAKRHFFYVTAGRAPRAKALGICKDEMPKGISFMSLPDGPHDALHRGKYKKADNIPRISSALIRNFISYIFYA